MSTGAFCDVLLDPRRFVDSCPLFGSQPRNPFGSLWCPPNCRVRQAGCEQDEEPRDGLWQKGTEKDERSEGPTA